MNEHICNFKSLRGYLLRPFSIQLFVLACVAFALIPVAVASNLHCRVLASTSCAPDACSETKIVMGHEPSIDLNEKKRNLKYCVGGKCVVGAYKHYHISKRYDLYVGEIAWPGYERSPGDRTEDPLGEIRLLLDTEVGFFFWRVPYLGDSASQEEEDVLTGDCWKP